MTTMTTDSNAMNWILEKAIFTDELNQNDIDVGCTKFVVGEFKGNLPWRMAIEIREWAKKNDVKREGYHESFYVKLLDHTEDAKRELVTALIEFGSTKRTNKHVNVIIDHTVEAV